MTLPHLLIVLGIVTGAAGLAVSLMGRRGLIAPETGPERDGRWPLEIAVALIVFFTAHVLFRAGQVFLIGGDEYCRFDYAMTWARRPFFAPADNIWLGGQFYILGALFRLTGKIQAVVNVTSLLGMAATVFFAARIGKKLWGAAGGATAGILVGTEWILLWTSVNPQAEVFAFPALLAGLDAWLAGWQAQTTPQNGGEHAGTPAEWHYLRAAVWIAFGTMFRYELWYVGICLGVFLIVRLVGGLGARPRRRLPLMAGCILLLIYPMAWMVSSYVQLGSPIAFLQKASQLNMEGNLFYDFSTAWKRFLAYPTALWMDHRSRLLLPLAGVALACLPRRRGALPFVLATGAMLLFSMLIAAKTGIGSNNRPRYTESLALPLLCLGAGPLAMLWRTGANSRAMRVCARILVLAFLITTAAVSIGHARRHYPHAYGIHPSLLTLAQRMQRGGDPARPWVPPVQEPGRPLIAQFEGDYDMWWFLEYHAAWPWDAQGSPSAEDLRARFSDAPAGTRIVRRRPEAPASADPPLRRAVLQEVVEPYEVWRIE